MKSNSQTQKLAISPDRVDCGHGKDISGQQTSPAFPPVIADIGSLALVAAKVPVENRIASASTNWTFRSNTRAQPRFEQLSMR
jgi:hypothetical protein